MKKIVAWFLAFLLTGALALFSVSLIGSRAVAPAMTEEGAPVSDTVIREEQALLRERLTAIADMYGVPAEPAVSAVDEETLRDLNTQASRWWSGVLMTGRPTEWVSWNADSLEQAMLSAAQASVPEGTEDPEYLGLASTEAVKKSVLRTVLPIRQEIIEPALQKARQKVDLPNLITFFLGVPWAALALCALLAGLIALLESRRLRGCLKYIGAALGAAALVTAAVGALCWFAGVGDMIREASASLLIMYRDVLSRTLVPGIIVMAVMIIGCVLCLALSRRREEAA